MITSFGIKHYKSILDQKIELGRINVFIGENGSGKTNILEAMAVLAAAVTDKLAVEELYARGIRVAKPSITLSSFHKQKQPSSIDFEWTSYGAKAMALSLRPDADDRVYSKWVSEPWLPVRGDLSSKANVWAFKVLVEGFTIYNLSTLALRGIESPSKRTPLGVNGESLDVLLSTFDKAEKSEVLERLKVILWIERFLVDPSDKLKYEGHKLGRSTSTLYFKDRFMRRGNNVFSAENANEGILHILFYLALFMSNQTPGIFGIDNIETALNPQMCRDLIKELAALAKKHDKQALITTHNPATLDGLNLHDDEQRLFVVSRNDHGHTVVERIKVKPQPAGEKYKLSELWMRGHLGGLPRRF